jgi:hypothetical protein
MAIVCKVLGHRARFEADGETMRWQCERDCGFAGERRYPTADDAQRYAAAFDRPDSEDLGHRAPLSLIALRLVRRRRTQHH